MEIFGLQKTTLLDYPGHLAAVIFTGGCNFRCPFCHNSSLIHSPNPDSRISEEKILNFLKKRQGILEGVCITGGEPTLQPDLPYFLEKIRELGYSIKLDTNGYRPQVLISLIQQGLIDYVAMDIKTSREHYPQVCGLPGMDISAIERSVDYLMTHSTSYEFRTTLVKELHSLSDMEAIGTWLKGCQAYFLQSYQDSEEVLQKNLHPFSKDELQAYYKEVLPYIPNTKLRGTD